MPELKRTGIMLIASIVIAALAYATILLLQKSDAPTINFARQVDSFIIRHCEITKRVPSLRALAARFPNLRGSPGWHFFSDARTYLRMQYPVKWWNGNAIGVRKVSGLTAIPYAYVVEYRCGKSR